MFDDTPAGSSWSLTEATPTPSGATCLRYDRRFAAPDRAQAVTGSSINLSAGAIVY